MCILVPSGQFSDDGARAVVILTRGSRDQWDNLVEVRGRAVENQTVSNLEMSGRPGKLP